MRAIAYPSTLENQKYLSFIEDYEITQADTNCDSHIAYCTFCSFKSFSSERPVLSVSLKQEILNNVSAVRGRLCLR